LNVLTIDVARHLQGRNPVRHGKECSFLLMYFQVPDVGTLSTYGSR
jgi:hypothetical protein